MAKKQKPTPTGGQHSQQPGVERGNRQPPQRQQHAENFIQGRERASDVSPSQQGGENFLGGRERASDSDRRDQR